MGRVVSSMKAILLNRHGDLNDVAYGDVPTPRPGPGEVLLEVKAAALNRLDLWITEGWRGLKLAFPHIMGCDGSGVVVEIGLDVVGFAPGDRVAVNPTRSCGMCEYCLVGRDNLCNHFAIFGEQEEENIQKSKAYTLRGLGYKGLGKTENAKTDLRKATELSVSNLWANTELTRL